MLLPNRFEYPPYAPPWRHLQNFEIWDVNITWNVKSSFLHQCSCFYDYTCILIRFLVIFSLPELRWSNQDFAMYSKNQRFLVIMFNVTVSSPNIWYNYNLFNVKQIRHKICHKFMIQHGGRYVRTDSHKSPIFIPKFIIYDQCITSSTWSPPMRPPYWNIVFSLMWFYAYFTWK